MRNQNRRITAVTALVAIALTGLAAIQIILLGQALESEEEAFQGTVSVALHRVAQALSTQDIMDVLLEADVVDADSIDRWTGTLDDTIDRPLRRLEVELDRADTGSRREYSETLSVIRTLGNIAVRSQIVNGSDTVMVDTLQSESLDSLRSRVGDGHGAEWRSGYSYQTIYSDSGSTSFFTPHGDLSDSSRSFLVQFVLTSLETREVRPLAERVDSTRLDSMIAASLATEGIDLAYNLAVIDRGADSIAFAADRADTTALLSSPYRSRLFPHDVMASPADVVVTFPDKTSYIWAQMFPIAGPAALFLLLVVVGFVYAVRMLMHQQRMSRRLTDFINNMTHEFKTPISTIRLATEALLRPDVRNDTARVEQFNRMILEENRRMMLQVDKILHMSVLEDGSVELQRAPVDMSSLVDRAVNAMQLTLDERDGQLEVLHEADHMEVAGDAVHLANVVYSLLDNANKYSIDAPDIRIATSNEAGQLVIRIADRGIGIAAEDQKQVFDRYYRVSTGDRHDVRGFGLGLTYVKTIVEAHGGSISLASRLGSGTEVVIRLPLTNGGPE